MTQKLRCLLPVLAISGLLTACAMPQKENPDNRAYGQLVKTNTTYEDVEDENSWAAKTAKEACPTCKYFSMAEFAGGGGGYNRLIASFAIFGHNTVLTPDNMVKLHITNDYDNSRYIDNIYFSAIFEKEMGPESETCFTKNMYKGQAVSAVQSVVQQIPVVSSLMFKGMIGEIAWRQQFTFTSKCEGWISNLDPHAKELGTVYVHNAGNIYKVDRLNAITRTEAGDTW
jgi:hypothetical protein